MNAMLFCAISAGLMVTALPVEADSLRNGASAPIHISTPAPAAKIADADIEISPTRVAADYISPERAAADDAEFERLMEAAPDVGTFGESVNVDPETGVETRVSGFGFQDE